MRLLFLIALLSLASTAVAGNLSEAELLPPPEINIEQKALYSTWHHYYQNNPDLQQQTNHHKKTYLNELIFSQSPYLLQHAHNPVNWKPWRPEVLEEAKNHNKLIFLSIGYSTCHWCQVMEKESFENVELAQQINKDFIAIKVDREELPHIDDYYASALEHVKGSAGWPISVIITGDGLPLFIDAYLTKKQLTTLLTKINRIWLNQPDFLLSNAKELDSLVRKMDHTQMDIEAIEHKYRDLNLNRRLLGALDSDQGGFKGEVKFPSEAMLLYGLDQLRRAANPTLEAIIKQQLDNMITRGLYDPIDGGFHRYSTNSDWTVPHFEKMLYNQAQLIEVYAQAYRYYKESRYQDVVRESADFLLKHFYIQGKGFASAMDANFNGVEGGYYLWNREELVLFGDDQNQLQIEPFPTKESDQFLIFLPQVSEKVKKTNIQNIRDRLQAIRAAKGTLNIDRKILTGWNGLAIKALVTASQTLNNPIYTEKAQQTAQYLWNERFDHSSGYLSRTGFNNKNGQSASVYLEDYAYFADALISLYDITTEISWLKKANDLKNTASSLLLDEEGAFANTTHQGTNLALKRSKDSELISASAVMLEVYQKLNRRMESSPNKKSIQNIQFNLQAELVKEPLNHLYSAFSLNQISKSSTADTRYFASAKGKITSRCQKIIDRLCSEFILNIQLSDGWHINSNTPLQDYLIATKVEIPNGFKVDYPKETRVTLGFENEPLSLFEGSFKITIKREGDTDESPFLTIPLQACSDSQCLLPEFFSFSMK